MVERERGEKEGAGAVGVRRTCLRSSAWLFSLRRSAGGPGAAGPQLVSDGNLVSFSGRAFVALMGAPATCVAHVFEKP